MPVPPSPQDGPHERPTLPAPSAGEEPVVFPDTPTRIEGLPASDTPTVLDPTLLAGSAATDLRNTSRYQVEAEIGRGGMGVVYRAYDRDLRRTVAMKVLSPTLGDEPVLATRFVEEAQATAQLQHPGIVPVYEIGIDPGRRLFFTMKLVTGSTLAQLVALPQSERPSRFRLIQYLIDAARAVNYAHSKGVVHRDLKPQNLMIGAYGEMQVMDWGLARVRDALEGVGISLDSGRTHTHAGALLGTPAYMAPEQAEANPAQIGPLSDVYGLGGILYHLLTGRPPHQHSTTQDIIDHLRAGQPVPRLRTVDRRIPRELDAICRRAMAPDPTDRYPSAEAFAEDLQAFIEDRPVSAAAPGPIARLAKLARRHRGITVTAVAALVVGLVAALAGLWALQRERDEADRRKEEAVALRQQSDALVRAMLYNLFERLEPLGQVELLDSVIEPVEQHFALLPPTDDPQELRDRFQAFYNVAAVRRKMNDLPAAIRASEAAIVAARRALETPVDLIQARTDLLAALIAAIHINELAQNETRHEELVREVMQQAERLEADHPSLATRRVRAVALSERASLRRQQGRLAEAQEDFRQALEILDEELKEAPATPPLREARVHVTIGLAACYQEMGDLERALVLLQQAERQVQHLIDHVGATRIRQARRRGLVGQQATLQHRLGGGQEVRERLIELAAEVEELVARDPHNVEHRRELTRIHDLLGRMFRAAGRLDQARDHFERAVATSAALLAGDPTNAAGWTEHGQALYHLTGLLVVQGDVQRADARLGQLQKAARELEARSGQQVHSDRLWLLTLVSQARIALSRGRTQAALEALHRANEYAAKTADYRPGSAQDEQFFSMVRYQLGALLVNLGAADESVPMLESALEQMSQQYQAFPESTHARSEAANGLLMMARARTRAGQAEPALPQLKQARSLLEGLLAKHPAHATWRSMLAETHKELGVAAAAVGDDPLAEASHERAVALRQQLVTEEPDHPRFRSLLADALHAQGHQHQERSELQAAFNAYAEALRIRKELHESRPKQAAWARSLAESYEHVGHLVYDDGKWKEAFRLFRLQYELRVWLAETDPANDAHQWDLVHACVDRARPFERTPDGVAAALEAVDRGLRLVEELEQAGRIPEDKPEQAGLWRTRLQKLQVHLKQVQQELEAEGGG